MATVADYIQSFVYNNPIKAKQGSVSTVGDKLYSYNTVIAERQGEHLIVNMTKYSSTTSTQQNLIVRYIEQRGTGYSIVKDPVPVNTQTLIGLEVR